MAMMGRVGRRGGRRAADAGITVARRARAPGAVKGIIAARRADVPAGASAAVIADSFCRLAKRPERLAKF